MSITIDKMTKGNIVFVIPVRINYTRTSQYVWNKKINAKLLAGILRDYGLGVFFLIFPKS